MWNEQVGAWYSSRRRAYEYDHHYGLNLFRGRSPAHESEGMKHYASSITHIPTLIILLSTFSMPPYVAGQQPRRSSASVRKPQQAVPKAHFDSGNSALRIPLEIDNNLILMRVSVNDSKPLRFIFDTGASHSVMNSPRVRELGLKTQGQVSGDATGGVIQGSFVHGVSLSVQGAKVSNQSIGAFAFPTVPGFEFDGVIGYDFINQFVVEIDYENKIMNLYEPRTYRYSGKGHVIPLILAGRRIPLVRTTIMMEGRAPIAGNLEVDTGGDGTFIINSPFVKKHRLAEALSETIQGSGRGAGGEEKRLFGRVKAMQFGRVIINEPPIGLAQNTEGASASEDNDGRIGGEVFRRFKVILDYSRKQIILEPNKSLNDPYEVETGLL